MRTVPCLHCGAPFGRLKAQKYCSLRCALLSRVDVRGEDDCWPWLAAVGSHGYGVFSFDGVMYTSHRAAHLVFVGEIPDADGGHGGVVMHSCDNRPCCNGRHLGAGSQAANLADAHEKGRLVFVGPRGELARTAVLTEEKVLDVRRRLALGETGRALARELGVSPSCVSHINLRKSWAHI